MKIEIRSGNTEDLRELLDAVSGGDCTVDVRRKRKRTSLQNAALHQGFKHIAQVCAENGITLDQLCLHIYKEMRPVTPEHVKDVCRELCQELFGSRSTTAIPPDQCKTVWNILARAFAIRLGVDIGDFPSLESLRINSQIK